MGASPAWRDTFCGRVAELAALENAFNQVARGHGPQLAVVLGERGMGKTRLVQELYRVLTLNHDPHDYWPNAVLFAGNNLRVAPEMMDASTRDHFARVELHDIKMPFLWWGFRIVDPLLRNAGRSDLTVYRQSLDPHLGHIRHKRAMERAGRQIAGGMLETGKSVLSKGIEAIPIVGPAASLAFEAAERFRSGYDAMNVRRGLARDHRVADVAGIAELAQAELLDGTLEDLSVLLRSEPNAPAVPVILFCDDAQFANSEGDEIVLRMLGHIWERARDNHWPLLLIATHWTFEWHEAREGQELTFASQFGSYAADPRCCTVLELKGEPALQGIVRAGLSTLSEADARLLLYKADGNPLVLIELIQLVHRSPVWIDSTGKLTPSARERIRTHSSDLTRLILDRLQSDATPASVRLALAVASKQGLRFVRPIVEAVGRTMSFGELGPELEVAARLRIIVPTSLNTFEFMQRAHYDAATMLLDSHVADPEALRHTFIEASLATSEDETKWLELSRYEQMNTIGLLIVLARSGSKPDVEHRVGQLLLALVRALLDEETSASFAYAFDLAEEFIAGLDARWKLEHYSLHQLDSARVALDVWRGASASRLLSSALADLARRKADGDDPSDEYRLPIYLRVYGQTLFNEGRLEDAERVLQECLRLVRRAGIDTPSSAELPSVLSALANTYASLGRLREAEQGLREALELAQRAAQSDTDSSRRGTLAAALTDLGRVLYERGDLDSAEELIREALGIRRELESANRSIESDESTSSVLSALAQIALDRGLADEAEALCREELELLEQIYQRIKTPSALRTLYCAKLARARILCAIGRWAEAERDCRECLAMNRQVAELVASPAIDTEALRIGHDLGMILRSQDRAQESHAVYESCKKIADRLARQDLPPETRRDISIVLEEWSTGLVLRGNHAEAEPALRENLVRRDALALELGTPRSRRDLSVALVRLGSCVAARGESAEAHAFFARAVEIRRQLYAQLETSVARSDLAELLFLAASTAKDDQGDGYWEELEKLSLSQSEIGHQQPNHALQRAQSLAWLALQNFDTDRAKARQLLEQAESLFDERREQGSTSFINLSRVAIDFVRILCDLADTENAAAATDACRALKERVQSEIQTNLVVRLYCDMLDSILTSLEDGSWQSQDETR